MSTSDSEHNSSAPPLILQSVFMPPTLLYTHKRLTRNLSMGSNREITEGASSPVASCQKSPPWSWTKTNTARHSSSSFEYADAEWNLEGRRRGLRGDRQKRKEVPPTRPPWRLATLEAEGGNEVLFVPRRLQIQTEILTPSSCGRSRTQVLLLFNPLKRYWTK